MLPDIVSVNDAGSVFYSSNRLQTLLHQKNRLYQFDTVAVSELYHFTLIRQPEQQRTILPLSRCFPHIVFPTKTIIFPCFLYFIAILQIFFTIFFQSHCNKTNV